MVICNGQTDEDTYRFRSNWLPKVIQFIIQNFVGQFIGLKMSNIHKTSCNKPYIEIPFIMKH